jgi:uncharacterized protein with HEPN domain
MKRDVRLYVRDISEAISSIESFTSEMSYEEFVRDERTNSAVVWKIQIIGEAVKNIPRPLRQRHSEIPWKELAGMRDRIAHSYFGIDYEIVWRVARIQLPEIKPHIDRVLQSFGEDTLL